MKNKTGRDIKVEVLALWLLAATRNGKKGAPKVISLRALTREAMRLVTEMYGDEPVEGKDTIDARSVLAEFAEALDRFEKRMNENEGEGK